MALLHVVIIKMVVIGSRTTSRDSQNSLQMHLGLGLGLGLGFEGFRVKLLRVRG